MGTYIYCLTLTYLLGIFSVSLTLTLGFIIYIWDDGLKLHVRLEKWLPSGHYIRKAKKLEKEMQQFVNAAATSPDDDATAAIAKRLNDRYVATYAKVFAWQMRGL